MRPVLQILSQSTKKELKGEQGDPRKSARAASRYCRRALAAIHPQQVETGSLGGTSIDAIAARHPPRPTQHHSDVRIPNERQHARPRGLEGFITAHEAGRLCCQRRRREAREDQGADPGPDECYVKVLIAKRLQHGPGDHEGLHGLRGRRGPSSWACARARRTATSIWSANASGEINLACTTCGVCERGGRWAGTTARSGPSWAS